MHESASPVQVFAALADDSRWQVLVALGRRPASASSLAEELPISRQAIAKHLKVLTDVGLVVATRVGREVRYEAVGARLQRGGAPRSTVSRRVGNAGWPGSRTPSSGKADWPPTPGLRASAQLQHPARGGPPSSPAAPAPATRRRAPTPRAGGPPCCRSRPCCAGRPRCTPRPSRSPARISAGSSTSWTISSPALAMPAHHGGHQRSASAGADWPGLPCISRRTGRLADCRSCRRRRRRTCVRRAGT